MAWSCVFYLRLVTPNVYIRILCERKMVVEAEVAFHKAPRDSRSFHTSFMTVRSDRIDDAKALITRFQKEFNELMDDQSGEDIFQLNIQFFPVTNITSKAK